MTEADVVPIRALTEDEALAWVVSHAPVSASNAELARRWLWNDMKVSRRVKTWVADGRIERSPNGLTAPSQRSVGRRYAVTVDAVKALGSPNVAHRILAYAMAVSLASAAAYFSIGGMVELFAAQAVAVTVLGALLEATKLVMVAWLTANWSDSSGLLRLVMTGLVVGLMVVNGAGVFARLIESHLAPTATAASAVAEQLSIVDAKIIEQQHRVDGIAAQDREVADAVGKLKGKAALAAITLQQKRRDGIARERQIAAERLVALQGERAHLDAEGRLVAIQTGPARFLAATLGIADSEAVIRWLVALLVLLTDPSAVVLTIAASRRGGIR